MNQTREGWGTRRRRNLVRGRRPAAESRVIGGRFSAGLKSSFPLLKSGGSHRGSATPPRRMTAQKSSRAIAALGARKTANCGVFMVRSCDFLLSCRDEYPGHLTLRHDERNARILEDKISEFAEGVRRSLLQFCRCPLSLAVEHLYLRLRISDLDAFGRAAVICVYINSNQEIVVIFQRDTVWRASGGPSSRNAELRKVGSRSLGKDAVCRYMQLRRVEEV